MKEENSKLNNELLKLLFNSNITGHVLDFEESNEIEKQQNEYLAECES